MHTQLSDRNDIWAKWKYRSVAGWWVHMRWVRWWGPDETSVMFMHCPRTISLCILGSPGSGTGVSWKLYYLTLSHTGREHNKPQRIKKRLQTSQECRHGFEGALISRGITRSYWRCFSGCTGWGPNTIHSFWAIRTLAMLSWLSGGQCAAT